MSKFFCTSQSKDSSQTTCLSFRTSPEPSRNQNRNRDVDTEARRKAAAWAWHERAGGELIPTRPRGGEYSAALSRHTGVDGPISVLNVVDKRDGGAHESSSKSITGSRTSLFDASELSSLSQQIARFAQKLQEECARENFSAQLGDVNKSNRRASDCPSSTDQQACGNEFTRHRRSFSDPTGPPQCLYETCGPLRTERNVATPSDSSVECGFSQTGFANVHTSRKSSLRKPLALIQKLCRKISKGNEGSRSELLTRVQSHYHFHNHYHFFPRHTDPDDELRILERPQGGRHSENYTPYSGSADKEKQKSAAAAYWASVGDRVAGAQGGTAEIYEYDSHLYPEESLKSTASISKDWAHGRNSDNFDSRGDKAHGSAQIGKPRTRRYSMNE